MYQSRAFTILELMITLAIAAVLVAIAVPNFQDSIIRARLSSQSSDLLATLQLARSDAVMRNEAVTVCVSSNGRDCLTSGTQQWENGWIAYLDATPTSLLRVISSFSSGYTLRSASSIGDSITFAANGRSSATGQFVSCYDGAVANSKAVFVATSGRIYEGKDNNGNGIPEDEFADDITSCDP